jgi:hypothetical protein
MRDGRIVNGAQETVAQGQKMRNRVPPVSRSRLGTHQPLKDDLVANPG